MTEHDLMEPSYLDINIDDKTHDIIVIDVKPHRRCLNWVIKRPDMTPISGSASGGYGNGICVMPAL